MHSPLDTETVEEYFSRFNNQLRRMPQQERAELHCELRQHLDALIAAHEELGALPEEAVGLALRSFGDPAKIGRKLFWEWQISQRGNTRLKLLTTLLASCLLVAVFLFCASWPVQAGFPLWASFAVSCMLPPLISGSLVGFCAPRSGLFSCVYGCLLPGGWWLLHDTYQAAASCGHSLLVFATLSDAAKQSLANLAQSTSCSLLVVLSMASAAYFAGALRRGGLYRVRASDLALR